MGALELAKPLPQLQYNAESHLQYKNRYKQIKSSHQIFELMQRRMDIDL